MFVKFEACCDECLLEASDGKAARADAIGAGEAMKRKHSSAPFTKCGSHNADGTRDSRSRSTSATSNAKPRLRSPASPWAGKTLGKLNAQLQRS